jgi:hypothetical protein
VKDEAGSPSDGEWPHLESRARETPTPVTPARWKPSTAVAQRVRIFCQKDDADVGNAAARAQGAVLEPQ